MEKTGLAGIFAARELTKEGIINVSQKNYLINS